MVLYFVMDMLQGLPGLPGLFIACLFSAALRYKTFPSVSLFFGVFFFLIEPNINPVSPSRTLASTSAHHISTLSYKHLAKSNAAPQTTASTIESTPL